MAKKKKKNTPEVKVPVFLSFLTGFRRFDWAALLLAAVIIIISALAAGHTYKLSEADPYGFLIWFLLIVGHIPMEIIEFTAKLTGIDGSTIESFIAHREAILLGACNLVMLAVCWAVLRFHVLKRYGAEPLRIAAIFFRLIFFWGIFQLFCFIAVKNWSDGKINPLHRELKKVSVVQTHTR
ncbi:MAG: hypothetical protein IKA87_00010 [Lentisphaeria bacterium]|nr:hypothetical protein [Lentisphaeria bacterium]